MSKLSDHEQQLAALKGLTQTTGIVHDAQVLQLRMWGGVAFGGGKAKWEAHFDNEAKTVTYSLKDPIKAPAAKKLVPAIVALDRSVQWLLGDDWGLVVEAGGNLIYRGNQRKQDKNQRRRAIAERGADRGRKGPTS